MVSTSRWQKLMAGSSWHGTHGNPGWFNWILIQKSIWLRYVMLGWFMGGVDLTGIYRRSSFNYSQFIQTHAISLSFSLSLAPPRSLPPLGLLPFLHLSPLPQLSIPLPHPSLPPSSVPPSLPPSLPPLSSVTCQLTHDPDRCGESFPGVHRRTSEG